MGKQNNKKEDKTKKIIVQVLLIIGLLAMQACADFVNTMG